MKCAGSEPLITQLEKEAEEFQAIVHNQIQTLESFLRLNLIISWRGIRVNKAITLSGNVS
ncbi:hypothetical protein ACX93W_24560 [Paenibacillus sp. CAU 1782]